LYALKGYSASPGEIGKEFGYSLLFGTRLKEARSVQVRRIDESGKISRVRLAQPAWLRGERKGVEGLGANRKNKGIREFKYGGRPRGVKKIAHI